MNKSLLVAHTQPKEDRYPLTFWKLCAAALLFFISFNMIIMELPELLRSMGGGHLLGLVFPMFAGAALITRPFSGALADQIGRKPVMLIGVGVTIVCSLFYPLVGLVGGFFALRFLHGFSAGFQPTGSSAMIADIIPKSRRGEAMGIFGIATSTGLAGGPVIGSEIARAVGLETMFYCASSAGVVALLIMLSLPETLANRRTFRPSMLLVRPADLIEPKVWPVIIVTVLSFFFFGVVITVMADFSTHYHIEILGWHNKGIFQSIMVTASLVVRFVAGRLSDRWGRPKVLALASWQLATAGLILAFGSTNFHFVMAGIILGLGVGFNSPTLFAWVVDLSPDHRKGIGLATMFIALETGIILGSLAGGYSYADYPDNIAHIHTPFLISAILALCSFPFLLWYMRREKKHQPQG